MEFLTYQFITLSMLIALSEQLEVKYGSDLVGAVYTEMSGSLAGAADDTILIPVTPCAVVSYIELQLPDAGRDARVRLDDVGLALHVTGGAADQRYVVIARNYPRPGCSLS